MTQKYFRRTEEKLNVVKSYNSYKNIRQQTSNQLTLANSKQQSLQRIIQIFSKKMINKKRYHFQILKQFYLFSDTSLNSSISSPSFYYAVLTGEQKIHSLFKILETKFLEVKIWGFLNLKLDRLIKNIKIASPIVNSFIQKKKLSQKQSAFLEIKTAVNNSSKRMMQQRIISITIVNDTPKKRYNADCNKSYYNVSRQTQIDSYSSQKSVNTKASCFEFSCTGCCQYSRCCDYNCGNCCQRGYSIEERMQYLRMLQEMAKQYQV